MRALTSLAVLIGASALLAACGGGGDETAPAATDAASEAVPAAAAPAAPEGPTDEQVQALLAELPAPYNAGDIEAGRMKFALCRSCHTINEGGPNMTGPNLHGVFGRHVGGKDDYNYSDALKAADFTWDAEKLDHWLANPKEFLPGDKMAFIGVKNPQDRVNLIAYLKVATSTAQ